MEPEAFPFMLLQQTWEARDSKTGSGKEFTAPPQGSDYRWKVPTPVWVQERAFLSWYPGSEKKFPCVPWERQHQ